MQDRKLQTMEPGLVKITYSFESKTQEEVALIMTQSLADCVRLPNNCLCYRYFLRDSMKAIWQIGLKVGLNVYGPFSGHKVRDEDILGVEGRVIQLSPSFCDFEKNYHQFMIPCNSPYFIDAIDEVKRILSAAGFNADASRWDDYKKWEEDKLKSFPTLPTQ